MSADSIELLIEKDMFNFSKVLFLETLRLCVFRCMFTGLKLVTETFAGFFTYVFTFHSSSSSNKSS